MNTERVALASLAAVLLLAGCNDEGLVSTPPSTFGEANRQTMMAQIIDPEPEYETQVPPSSAQHAAQAIDRYATDRVKQPERVSSTETTTSGSGSGR